MEKAELSLDLIKRAAGEDPQAQKAILKYYDAYINRLSLVVDVLDSGKTVRYIDEDKKSELQICALEAVKKWKPKYKG